MGEADAMAPPSVGWASVAETYWPRWLSALLIVTGIIVIVAETSNLLVLLGILLTGAGAYGAFHDRSGVGPQSS